MDRLLNRLFVLNKHIRYQDLNRRVLSVLTMRSPAQLLLLDGHRRDKHYKSSSMTYFTPNSQNASEAADYAGTDPNLNFTRSLKSDRHFSASQSANYGRNKNYKDSVYGGGEGSNRNQANQYGSSKRGKNQYGDRPSKSNSSRQYPSGQAGLAPRGDPLSNIKPLTVKPNMTEDDGSSVGKELTGELNKNELNRVINEFRQSPAVMKLAEEIGLNTRMVSEAMLSFRNYCIDSKTLPDDLHIKLSDIINGAANVTDLFPYFTRHSHDLFPHLACMDELKQISDLTEPAYWYPEAREIKRKVIYHSGPTNSGKTYSALRSFEQSQSGVYCGPLKLLASEIFLKTNKASTKCDLVTGEERRFANADSTPSEHVACTVEMANLNKLYDIAIIDEIQMIKDAQRGWAWTRAFLGLKAKEIHVCGDATSVRLISDLCFLVGDTFELREYQRLTKLSYMDQALESFHNVEPGDCFVCFNKADIFYLRKSLQSLGHEVAIIYGSMPPGVKLAQASRFNDPNDKLKILIATDAIGMGLNLNIRRVIFYSLMKPVHKRERQLRQGKVSSPLAASLSDTNMEMEYISTSQALQIAGRAGRFNTQFQDGLVTTYFKHDLPILKQIVGKPLDETVKAGLQPNSDQIELFAYHLPNHTLSNLLKIFINLSTIDNGKYFLCNYEDNIYLAEMIDHIPLQLKARYTFTLSPISRKNQFVCSAFVKFVRLYSRNEAVTFDFLKTLLGWPFKIPKTYTELRLLEDVYDVFDLYLWLSYRFPNIFVHVEQVQKARIKLEEVIHDGIKMQTFNQAGSPSSSSSPLNVLIADYEQTERANEVENNIRSQPEDKSSPSSSSSQGLELNESDLIRKFESQLKVNANDANSLSKPSEILQSNESHQDPRNVTPQVNINDELAKLRKNKPAKPPKSATGQEAGSKQKKASKKGKDKKTTDSAPNPSKETS